MPQITDQEKLKKDYELCFVSKGPQGDMWKGQYLKCPNCRYYVLKGAGYDQCPCGNITVDSDMLRVSIIKSSENEVEVYNAKKK